jgi:hypothetical protein
MNSILKECNLYTVCERRDVQYCKFLLQSKHTEFKNWFKFPVRQLRNRPELLVPTHKSSTFENSIKFCVTVYWNSLPRGMETNEMSNSKIIEQVKSILKSKRDNKL